MKFLQVFLRLWNKLFPKKKISHSQVQVKEEDKPVERIITPPAIIRKTPEKRVVQVGLDFGTSNTKIVYSLLGSRGAQKIPILFNHNLDIYPDFCLPSIAAVNDQNKLIFGIKAAQFLSDKSWDEGLRRLKVVVAGKYDYSFKDKQTENQFNNYLEKHFHSVYSISPEQITAIYLAYAMYLAQKEIKNKLASDDLNFMYNICIPIDHVENNEVRCVFEKILAWSELIEKEWTVKGESFDPLEFSIKVKDKAEYGALKKGSFLRQDQDARVFAVPESVAEIASYLYSSNRQSGMHAIIDLGAGTTDISIFNLNREFNNTHWYAAGNIPEGINKIERIIAACFKKQNSNCFCSYKTIFEFLKTLSSDKNIDSKIEKYIISKLNKLYDKSRKIWGVAYKRYKKEAAFHNVQLFITGGGADIIYVKEIFRVPWWSQIKKYYPITNLPYPADYISSNQSAPFQRMSVAYGLCRTIPEFEKFILPNEISDFEKSIDLGGGPEGIDDGEGLIPNQNWYK